MRLDEFIALIKTQAKTEEERMEVSKQVPLGYDHIQRTMFAFLKEPYAYKHLCVTGLRKTSFIKRLLITLSSLQPKTEMQVLVLSPKTEYGELLRLKRMDITVPYVRNKEDLANAMRCVKELVEQRAQMQKRPTLVVVLDGLEDLPACNVNGDLEEYREVFEILSHKQDILLITGAELIRSIFSGYPGAYVGVGNCLVTTREDGKADVTYVGEDASLTMPTPMSYPALPSITETLIALNAENKDE